jgi:hypothetical protein
MASSLRWTCWPLWALLWALACGHQPPTLRESVQAGRETAAELAEHCATARALVRTELPPDLARACEAVDVLNEGAAGAGGRGE